MACVRRICVYAFFIGMIVCLYSNAVCGKDGKSLNSENNTLVNSGHSGHFQWYEHRKLSWDDFRGPVNATTNESAAATHCGLGFTTTSSAPGSKPEIIVYNTFYTNKSWVRPDAKMSSILDHEQGHFDLCEIYTRKLRKRLSNFDFNVPDARQVLMNIYSTVSNEYEKRQQDYEQETKHGTNTEEQKRWQEIIVRELN